MNIEVFRIYFNHTLFSIKFFEVYLGNNKCRCLFSINKNLESIRKDENYVDILFFRFPFQKSIAKRKKQENFLGFGFSVLKISWFVWDMYAIEFLKINLATTKIKIDHCFIAFVLDIEEENERLFIDILFKRLETKNIKNTIAFKWIQKKYSCMSGEEK